MASDFVLPGRELVVEKTIPVDFLHFGNLDSVARTPLSISAFCQLVDRILSKCSEILHRFPVVHHGHIRVIIRKWNSEASVPHRVRLPDDMSNHPLAVQFFELEIIDTPLGRQFGRCDLIEHIQNHNFSWSAVIDPLAIV